MDKHFHILIRECFIEAGQMVFYAMFLLTVIASFLHVQYMSSRNDNREH